MCYSAQVMSSYRKYIRFYGAGISLEEFVNIYGFRYKGQKIIIPRAVDQDFLDSDEDEVAQIQAYIRDFRKLEETYLQQEIFTQRARQVEAEAKLQKKETATARKSFEVAGRKIDKCKAKLANLNRIEPRDSDARMYPGQYVPVMVMEAGKRVIKPMRYLCRPAGMPADVDVKYSGSYNARRDNLEGQYWRGVFGVSHGVAIVNAFYENVPKHKAEGRELAAGEDPQNTILEFKPQTGQDMIVACLWSHWRGREGDELLSFAFITDEPPPEVSAAGHDRCIVPIKKENIDRWLQPEGQSLADLYAILDDRERPYYEHQLAA